MFIHYTEIELNQIILNQTEEDSHLDYKGSGSLEKTDGKKKEIGKDISSFANSDGGIVIYGIREYDDLPRRHLPERIEPIERTFISKEWLEQVISSNIQPKINGLTIYPISLSSRINHVVYVVIIPKSNTAHQASDKRYYRRYNFESVAMEDYEIKDIINRALSPDLDIVLYPDETTFIENVLTFPLSLINKSKLLARDVKLNILFNDFQNYNIQQNNGFRDISHINAGKKLYTTENDLKIYNGVNTRIGTFSLFLNENIRKVNISSTILADNMFAETNNFEIIIENNIPIYNLI